jgi:hypothetical protein
MRKLIFFSLLITLIIGCCARGKKSPVEGIWKLAQGKWYNWSPGDTLIYNFPGNVAIYHIKIFSTDNVTFIGHYSLDTSTHDNYGGGTFSLDGDRYEENLLYAGKAIFNRKTRMLMEVINDTLIQKWPADENWKLADKYSFEKYVKLK